MTYFTTASAIVALLLSLWNFGLGFYDRRTVTKRRQQDLQIEERRIDEAARRAIRMDNRAKLDTRLEAAKQMVLDVKKQLGVSDHD